MSTKVLIKKSGVSQSRPTSSDLSFGELAINYEDGILYYKNGSGDVSIIAAGAGGGITITKITDNYTATSGEYLLADTSQGTFTITLPNTSSAGAFVSIFDGGSWTDTPVIIDPNDGTIENSGTSINLDISNSRVDFVYTGSTWKPHIPVTENWIEDRLTAFEDTVITYAIALG